MLSTNAEPNLLLEHFLPQMNPIMMLAALNKPHVQKRMMNPPSHDPSIAVLMWMGLQVL